MNAISCYRAAMGFGYALRGLRALVLLACMLAIGACTPIGRYYAGEDAPAFVAAGATDAAGTPYLLANVSGEVYEIDVEAGTARVVTTVTTGGPFDNLAFAPDGTLYLSSFVAPEVIAVSPDGVAETIALGG